MSANVETKFLQVKVPVENAECVRFIWRENQSNDLSTYEYTCQIFGAKDTPTRESYALQRTVIYIEDESIDVSKIVKRSFHMGDFFFSAESIQEANFEAKPDYALDKRWFQSVEKAIERKKNFARKMW